MSPSHDRVSGDELSGFSSEVNRYGDRIVATVQNVMEKELRDNAYNIEGVGVGGGVGEQLERGEQWERGEEWELGESGSGGRSGRGGARGKRQTARGPGSDNGPVVLGRIHEGHTVRDLLISFFANFGSARASAYLNRNSVGLTASSVAAIVAMVASATNHQSAALAPYCPHTTGIAPPGVNYVESFLNNASGFDGHIFSATITTSATTTNTFLQTSYPTAYPAFYFTHPPTFLTARALPPDERQSGI